MRIFGICGSPRIASTDSAVRKALGYAEMTHSAEIRYFSCHKKELNFCIHCDYCVKKREGCCFKDDMEEVYASLEWADALIVGTPVYQGTVSGQMKVLMDRCRALLARNPHVLSRKVGAALAVGGDRTGGQEVALQTILEFYVINEILPVGGGSFGANLGSTFWSRDLGAAGVEQDEEGIRTLQKTVDRLVQVARVIRRV
ncbi:MAG: flavodoxin family protein [Theionarchaea archaeon]|nr:flavodoxin family protein [Theionarchaea archaeon]MBU7038857.1 flavodoxin family protein [Theionarchaea archaeon]